MKRIIPLFLSACFFLAFMIMPARADEIDNSATTVDVLQYSTANNSGRNTFTFTGTYKVTYTLPESMYVAYVDMLLQTDGSSARPTEVLAGRGTLGSLTILQITAGLYRVYGTFPVRMTNYLEFEFTSARTSSSSLYQIVSLNISDIERRHFDDKVQCTTLGGSGGKTVTWSPGDSIVDAGFTASTADSVFSVSVTPLNWERYDYFDIYMMLSVFEIDSITARCGTIAVPLVIQYLDSGPSYGDYYYVMVRLDLRGLDKRGADPVMSITGVAKSGYNDVSVISGSGFIIYNPTDPYIYAIRVGTADLQAGLNNLANYIDMGFSGLYQVNQGGFQSIVDALSPESAVVDQYRDTVNQQSSDLGSISGAIGSVSRPDAGTIDFDVTSLVSTNSIMAATQPLAVIMNNSIFKTVILISVSLALAGYVLFGKR